MKKIKKFAAGGHYVMDGDSGRYVEDSPIADAPAPVAASVSPRMSGAMSAGLAPVLSDTAGGFQDNIDTSDVTARPMGLMIPPRRMGVPGAVPGTYAEMARGMGGMKKGGAVKKTTKVVKAKTATVRGHGIEQRGKTKGRFV
jgi:hypothetical protein